MGDEKKIPDTGYQPTNQCRRKCSCGRSEKLIKFNTTPRKVLKHRPTDYSGEWVFEVGNGKGLGEKRGTWKIIICLKWINIVADYKLVFCIILKISGYIIEGLKTTIIFCVWKEA